MLASLNSVIVPQAIIEKIIIIDIVMTIIELARLVHLHYFIKNFIIGSKKRANTKAIKNGR